jgi:hypothetical protein
VIPLCAAKQADLLACGRLVVPMTPPAGGSCRPRLTVRNSESGNPICRIRSIEDDYDLVAWHEDLPHLGCLRDTGDHPYWPSRKVLFAQMADVITECGREASALTGYRIGAATAGGRHRWSGSLRSFDEWCDGHEQEFLAILAEAARRLAERGRITAEDAARWTVLDNHPIIWRGQEFEDTGPTPGPSSLSPRYSPK